MNVDDEVDARVPFATDPWKTAAASIAPTPVATYPKTTAAAPVAPTNTRTMHPSQSLMFLNVCQLPMLILNHTNASPISFLILGSIMVQSNMCSSHLMVIGYRLNSKHQVCRNRCNIPNRSSLLNGLEIHTSTWHTLRETYLRKTNFSQDSRSRTENQILFVSTNRPVVAPRLYLSSIPPSQHNGLTLRVCSLLSLRNYHKVVSFPCTCKIPGCHLSSVPTVGIPSSMMREVLYNVFMNGAMTF